MTFLQNPTVLAWLISIDGIDLLPPKYRITFFLESVRLRMLEFSEKLSCDKKSKVYLGALQSQ